MILVEGPDGAGKTTLCQRLSKDLQVPIKDWEVDRATLPQSGVYRRVFESLASAVRGSANDPVMIQDRLYFSELVYGQVLRGKVAFNPRQQESIEMTLAAWDIPIIFCLPPLEIVQANVAASAGEQLEGVTDLIDPIYRHYRNLRAEWRKRPDMVMTYDYTGKFVGSSYEKILKVCEKYIERREARKWGK